MFKLLAVYISLITCAPGTPLYARYGHTALRVQAEEYHWDLVFNYGLFDFNTDRFYWKFVKGETYYMLGMNNMADFEREYRMENRPYYLQTLRMTEEQSSRLVGLLAENYRPENRQYLYNFVFDNCSTRPFALLQRAYGDSIASSYAGWKGRTYRDVISRYTGRGSWADFGINLLFGPRADRPMRDRDRLFLPEELMFYLSEAHLPDGTPVVADEQIQPFNIRSVPWYATWYAGAALFAVLMALLSLWDRHRGKLTYGVDIALGIVYLLLLVLVTFLTFFSVHPLVGFGWRLLIFPMIHLCARLVYITR